MVMEMNIEMTAMKMEIMEMVLVMDGYGDEDGDDGD